MLVDVLAWSFTLLGLVGALYTLLLGLMARVPAGGEPTRPPLRLGVLVPAHNEEALLPGLIRDLAGQKQAPAHCLVVADACGDATARLARDAGWDVLERPGPATGKPAALAAGLERLRTASCDAVVVLDADCRIDPGFLAGIHLAAQETGQTAVQLERGAGTAGLYGFASRLENRVFHRGRARLGFPAFLRGTGMVLGSEALARCPWRSDGLAEDRGQGLTFLQAGVPVRYLDHLTVRSGAPDSWGDAWVQRRRWVGSSLVSGVVDALRALPGGWRAVGPRILELPLAVYADARAAWGGALVLGAVLALISGTAPLALAMLGLLALAATALGFAWYGAGFLRILVEAPLGLALGAAASLLGLLGLGPARWRRGRTGGSVDGKRP